MRLRIKALLTTVAILTLGYVIVTLASIAQILDTTRSSNARMAKHLFTWAVQSGIADDSKTDVSKLSGLFESSALLTDWMISGPDGLVCAAADKSMIGNGNIKQSYPVAVAISSNGFKYKLWGRPSPETGILSDFIKGLVPAMIVSTVLLAVVLLMLLSRQVLTPVTELASASQRLAAGGPPILPRGADRNDEVGQLIKSFGQMSEEVLSHRKELERRVEEATDKFRRAQQAAAIAQRLAATGKLAAGVAHEINNPLGGMINAARQLETGLPQEGRQHQYLKLIQEGLERIGRIVKQMTRFQQTTRVLQKVDIEKTLEDALRFAGHRLKQAEVIKEYAHELPEVLGDHHSLEQVFLNLIINAADAVSNSPQKRLLIRTRLENDNIAVEIEDTGCGMTPEELDAAFDIFYTTKGPSEGSGLGLAVAHSIIESHSGHLRLESEKGKGSRAVVLLPGSRKDNTGENTPR